MKKSYIRKQENNEFQNLLAIMSPRGAYVGVNQPSQPQSLKTKKTPITQKKPLSRNCI